MSALHRKLLALSLGQELNRRALGRVGPTGVALAILEYVRCGSVYRREGFPATNRRIEKLAQRRSVQSDRKEDLDVAILEARQLLTILRPLGRVLGESSLCLNRSMPLTGALIAAGFKAELVIGKARHLINHRFEFHAWCEVCGTPVNETHQIPRGYWILTRIPKWDLVPTPTQERR